jgi:hypothetical protein
MTEHKQITAGEDRSSITNIYLINADYRFRHHALNCECGVIEIWNLEKRRIDRGQEVWRFVASDRSPIRLGNYCARLGITPDAENAELLASLAYR